MVSSRTWREHVEYSYQNKVFVNCIFVLVRNYKVFFKGIVQATLVEVHFNQELQWFRGGHRFFSSIESSF